MTTGIVAHDCLALRGFHATELGVALVGGDLCAGSHDGIIVLPSFTYSDSSRIKTSASLYGTENLTEPLCQSLCGFVGVSESVRTNQ